MKKGQSFFDNANRVRFFEKINFYCERQLPYESIRKITALHLSRLDYLNRIFNNCIMAPIAPGIFFIFKCDRCPSEPAL